MKRILLLISVIMIISILICGCSRENNISATNIPSIEPTQSSQNNTPIAMQTPDVTPTNSPNNGESAETSTEYTEPNIQSNYVYGGKVATDGNYQYFELSILDNPTIGLCKMEKDGSDLSVICAGDIYSINIADKYIYFIKSDNLYAYGGDVYRINKDGSGETEITKGDYSQVMLIGNNLFLLDFSDNKIYRMNCDGTDKRIFISDECDTFLFNNGFIYTPLFIKEKGGSDNLVLAKYDIDDSSKKTIITKDLPVNNDYSQYLIYYFINKNKIYYLNEQDQHIYCMKDDGTDKRKLNDIKVASMLMSEDGTIYAFSEIDIGDNEILSFDAEGNNVKTIYKSSDNDKLIGLADNYIYYWQDWGEGSGKTGRIKIDGTGNEIRGDKYKQ